MNARPIDTRAHDALAEVKAAIRTHGVAWPGGYPIGIIMGDGEVMCTDCARSNFRLIVRSTREPVYGREWTAVGSQILWEGPDETCCNCNKAMPTAYGTE